MFLKFWNNWLGQIKSCSSCLSQSAASLHSPPLTRLPGLTLPLPLLNSHWSVSPPPRLSLVQSCHAWWRSSLFILFKDLSVRGCVSQVCLQQKSWKQNDLRTKLLLMELMRNPLINMKLETNSRFKSSINVLMNESLFKDVKLILLSPHPLKTSTNTSRNVIKIKLLSLVLISLLICQN